jgi:ADP-dependent NAD(P)H-hydrate dehydratase / NAD(P)H-hydrate epimerase
MKIFTSKQMQMLDKDTISSENILSIDLMEKAAQGVKQWVLKNLNPDIKYYVFCGVGNNGGDGLAIARLLTEEGYDIEVFLIKYSGDLSLDCATNEKRLWEMGSAINYINTKKDLPNIQGQGVIFDAIFGTGLNRAVSGIAEEVIDFINDQEQPVISIDIPSGLSGDGPNFEGSIIVADVVLSFQLPKLSFLLPENEDYLEHWTVIDIGLSYELIDKIPTAYDYFLSLEANQLLTDPNKFSHKGDNGHGLLIAGSKGMAGASVLSAKAAMRSGIGKLTVAVPERNYTVVQTSIPEAICIVQGEVYNTRVPEQLENFDFVAIGPGLGVTKETTKLVEDVLKKTTSPMVIDADALNIISANPKLLKQIPKNSILTPHLGEFARLIGKDIESSFERLEALKNFSIEHEVIVVLKGAYSAIALPNGKIFFNSTGNPGMSSAGCGDVLTGVLLALMAQGYNPADATLLGVNLHGLAGDLCLETQSTESLIATDVVNHLGKAFHVIRNIEAELEEKSLELGDD